jgi:hypothetical protein
VEHLDVLEEYRQLCTREGRYEEAARATAELSRIRTEEEAARNAALRARHAAGEPAAASATTVIGSRNARSERA